MNTEKIIDEAFQLYMPQVRSEITQLTDFIQTDILDKRENDPFYQYNILEIGTKFGGTFYLWNKLNELTNGMNVSVDFSDGGLHGGISEEEMDKRDLWFSERFDNCHFIRGDSHELATHFKVRDLICPNKSWRETIDFLFIDGDHSYKGVAQDFKDYSPFVKKGGIICFHDIVISDQHHERNVYVGEFWKELTKNKMPENESICIIDGQAYEIYEFIEDKNQTWAGLGLLRKI